MKKLAVIGDPVKHSLSPEMHNAALQELGLDYTYDKIHVRPANLKSFLKKQALQLKGFNSTLPHKEALLKLLDWISPKAKLIGAVNTVLRHEKKWIGFNTDGDGYLESLWEDHHWSPAGKNITLLGAGGAARALAVTMAIAGARRVTIANRTLERAKRLVQYLKKHLKKTAFSYTALSGVPFEKVLKNSDLLTNTTRVGLGGTQFLDFPWQHLNAQALVSDIVYTPLITPFLKAARQRRHPIHTGEGMLVYQGALSFQLWTGKRPNVALMRQIVLKKLKEA